MHGSTRTSEIRGEFAQGWRIVAAATLGVGLGLSPLPVYTLGMLAPQLAADFGWSIAQVMGVLSITTLAVVLSAPLTGMLTGRFGARRVALCSLVLFGCGVLSLASSSGSILHFYLTWAFIALGGAGTLPITWTRLVNDHFQRNKGLALGLAMMGSGLFGIAAKPYVGWLIAQWGWRGAFIGLGLLPLVLALPIAFMWFRNPAPQPGDAPAADLPTGGMTMAQAVRDWRFWLLAVALVPISFALGGAVPNMEGILRSGDLSSGTIASLTPLIGLSAIIGRLVGGWLLDRFWAPAIGAILLSLPGLSYWTLFGGPIDPQAAALSIFLIGFALGIEYDFIAFIVARYFGMKHYGTIYGWLYIPFAIGAGFAAPVFGYDFDVHGTYALSLSCSAVALLVCAAALLLLGPYRRFEQQHP
ncbi:MFS transporter [Novosphingobium gossypii]|uniref:MFS transporter n=1 Tax=Novosphingobium gossypii TaxID=1604774 RepID=UPI003D208961